jgi:hypothetical protein
MKEHRIVASNAPVTTINVAGTPHHYFHSERLGKVRLIQIADDANLAFAANQAPTPDDDDFIPDEIEKSPYSFPDEPDYVGDGFTDEYEADYLPGGKHHDPDYNQCVICGDWIRGYDLCDKCWED